MQKVEEKILKSKKITVFSSHQACLILIPYIIVSFVSRACVCLSVYYFNLLFNSYMFVYACKNEAYCCLSLYILCEWVSKTSVWLNIFFVCIRAFIFSYFHMQIKKKKMKIRSKRKEVYVVACSISHSICWPPSLVFFSAISCWSTGFLLRLSDGKQILQQYLQN